MTKICHIDSIDVTPDQNVMILMDSNSKKLKVFDYMLTYRAAYSFESSEYGSKALAVLNNDEGGCQCLRRNSTFMDQAYYSELF